MDEVGHYQQGLTQSLERQLRSLDLGDEEFLERRYARRAPAYFSRLALRLRVIDVGPYVDMLDEAMMTGDLSDVERAADRAALLRKLGHEVMPVVAGRQINAEAATLAVERGVWYVLERRAVAPPGLSA